MPAADETYCIHLDYERAWEALYTRRYDAYEQNSIRSVLETMWASWVDWFQHLEGQKTPGSPVNGSFAVFFERWLLALLDKFSHREFTS